MTHAYSLQRELKIIDLDEEINPQSLSCLVARSMMTCNMVTVQQRPQDINRYSSRIRPWIVDGSILDVTVRRGTAY